MGKASQAVGNIVVFILPVLIFTNAVVPERFYYFRLNKRVSWLPMLLGALALLTSVFFIDYIYAWNQSLITDPALLEQEKLSNTYSTWIMSMPDAGSLLLCLLCNALVPAFAEELFFRAGIQQLLSAWVKKHHVAILLSAAFFSFLHFDASGFLVRFLLGAALGYLFYWSGSLRLSILAHFTFNAFSIADSYIEQHFPQSAWANLEITPVLALISLVVSVGALLTCRNFLLRKSKGA
jgi:membrane protease YdiL (CAAX protease family)